MLKEVVRDERVELPKISFLIYSIYVVIIGEQHINLDSIKKLVGDRGNAPLLPACKTGTLLLS